MKTRHKPDTRGIVHILFAVFMAVLLVAGIAIYRDYGIPIDEYSQMEIGRVNLERVVSGSMEVQSQYDRYYGPAFEVPLTVFARAAGRIAGISEIDARHLGNYLFFLSSLVVLYAYLGTLYGHPVFGLAGAVLLAATPKIFAESFYNTKDVAFLSVTVYAMYAFSHGCERSLRRSAILALVCGYAIAVRAQGMVLAAAYAITIALTSKGPIPRRIVRVSVFMILTAACAYMFFPVFWNHFPRNLAGFWTTASHQLGVPTMYLGRLYVSPVIPWHYHVVWITVSGLLSVVVSAIAGLALFGAGVMSRRRSDDMHRDLVAPFLIVAATLVVSVLLRPRMYDGWRHIYYVYPPLIVFALLPLKRLSDRVRFRAPRLMFVLLALVMAADVAVAAAFFVRNHPYQYVYFNALAGGYGRARQLFDFDYWGVSYRQLDRYLSARPLTPGTRVYFEQPLPYAENVMIPALLDRGAVITETPEDADIIVSINRDAWRAIPEGFAPAFTARVEGVTISAVYVRKTATIDP